MQNAQWWAKYSAGVAVGSFWLAIWVQYPGLQECLLWQGGLATVVAVIAGIIWGSEDGGDVF